MTDIRRLLAEEDPVVAEPALPASAVAEMRRHILRTQRDRDPVGWTVTLTLASALLVIVAAGVATTWPATSGEQPVASQPETIATRAPGSNHRQLQFATPDGTRVIWVFNSDFDMR